MTAPDGEKEHSIFAPSGSPMWAFCAGSLRANMDQPDTAGIEARIGTIAHTMGERWLTEGERPDDMLGVQWTWAPPDEDREETYTVTEEMFSYVKEYVDWCNEAAEGANLVRVEQRVDHSLYMPIPDQKGTSDHVVIRPIHYFSESNLYSTGHELVVTDLKYGMGVRVYAEWNTQALIYALGTFLEWDGLFDIQTITVRICQPRLEVFESWSISRDDLMVFAGWLKARAALAWTHNAPRTPSPKACQWCKVKATCPALSMMMEEIADDVFADLDHGTYAERQMVDHRPYRPDLPEPIALSSHSLEIIKLWRPLIESWLSAVELELLRRAHNGAKLDHFDLGVGLSRKYFISQDDASEWLDQLGLDEEQRYTRKFLSPNQAVEKLHAIRGIPKARAKRFLADLVAQTPGPATLVGKKSDRERVEPLDLDDIYADLDE